MDIKEKDGSSNYLSINILSESFRLIKEIQDLIDKYHEKYSVYKDSAKQWKFFEIYLHYFKFMYNIL